MGSTTFRTIDRSATKTPNHAPQLWRWADGARAEPDRKTLAHRRAEVHHHLR
jgi:hypothetical protein